jgi:type IV pilus assembly protein PilQ
MMPTRKIDMGIIRKFFAMKLQTKSTRLYGKLLATCLLLMLSANVMGADKTPTEPQKTLDFIDFKKLPDNGVEIRLALSGKAPHPIDFTSKSPARISLDLPDINNNLPWNLPLPIDVGVAKNIKAVQARGRTRVIVGMKKLVTYQLRTENKNIFLTISGDSGSSDTGSSSSTSGTKASQAPVATATPAPKVAAPAPQPKPAATTTVKASKPAPRRASGSSTRLKNVTFSSLPGDTVQVRLNFSKPVAIPGNFTINKPARIVLDFPKTSSGLAWKNKNIGIGMAKSITAVEAGDRTRVILNLIQLIPFETEASGNNIIVTLAGSRTAATSTPSVSVNTAGTMATKGLHRIKNIDFRRGKKGEGRVIVTLSDNDTPVSTGESGQQIFVEFGDTGLPKNLQQRLDVTDFATPVQYIDATQTGDKVRMAITPVGNYEYLAYYTGNTYTIEVKEKPKEKQAKTAKNKFGYTGDKLSLNFQDIEVRAVLQLIADFTGLNMVTSDSVTGSLTLRLKNVPWDQALDIILKTKGLAMRKAGNVIMVAPAAEVAAQEKLELESNKQIEKLAPLRTEMIQINYAKASDIANLLSSKKGGLLSERGNISVDARTNTILVSDTADKIDGIRKLVGSLDIPVRQVMIESRIVIADDSFAKDLGVRFGVTSFNENNGTIVNNTGSGTGADTMVGSEISNLAAGGPYTPVTSPVYPNRLNVNMPAVGNAGRFALSILGSNTLLDLELSALQTEGRGEVLSNPRVVTANQKQATIEQGTQIPYQEASSSGATSTSFKNAVLKLEVTPQITPDERVILDLDVSKDSVGVVFGGVPSIDTKEVKTQVLMNNGETVVLGGIYEQNKRKDSTRVPFFGDLPFLGALFRSTSTSNSKSELLIFVTPKILKQNLGTKQK